MNHLNTVPNLLKLLVSIYIISMPLSVNAIELYDSTFFYKSTGETTCDSTIAISKIVVDKKTDKNSTVHYYYKFNDTWKLIDTKNYQFKKQDRLFISDPALSYFQKRVKRYYTPLSDSLYLFSEWNMGVLNQRGYAKSICPLILEDTVRTYHSNGKIKTLAYYHDNKPLYNSVFNQKGEKYMENVFNVADEYPRYSLGEKFLRDYIKMKILMYVDINEINDDFMLTWIIDKEGKISNVKVEGLNTANLETFFKNAMLSMEGDWVPAKLNNDTINFRMTMPINIKSKEAVTFNNFIFDGGSIGLTE